MEEKAGTKKPNCGSGEGEEHEHKHVKGKYTTFINTFCHHYQKFAYTRMKK